MPDTGAVEAPRELCDAGGRALASLDPRGEGAHLGCPFQTEKFANGAGLPGEIRHQTLVAHLVPVERKDRSCPLGKIHHGVVELRGASERQHLVHRRIHLEAASEAAQHHVPRIATDEQDLCIREQARNQRQLQRVERMLVDEDIARDVDPAPAHALPVRRPQHAKLALVRARKRLEIERLTHESQHAFGQEFVLLEAHDARVAVKDYLEEGRTRARKTDEQDMASGPAGHRFRRGACRPTGRDFSERLDKRVRIGKQARASCEAPMNPPQRLITVSVGTERLGVTAGGVEHVAEQSLRAGSVGRAGARIRKQLAQAHLGRSGGPVGEIG